MKKVKPYEDVDKLFDLKGKACLVVGLGGIGAVAAEAFAAKGAKVIVADINLDAANAVKDKITQNGGIAHAYTIDVTRKDSVQAVVDSTVKLFGRIDVLVNAAGVSAVGKAVDFDEKALERVLDINLKGTIFLSQCVGKVMASQKHGKIINLGSIGGERNHTTCTMPYSASKGGVHQVTRSFAGELAEFGVNVNAIAPSWVHTPMMDGREERVYEGIRNGIPFGRMLEPHELVGTVIFLASDASDFVTGITLPVDGGYLACKPLY